jgi:hypothetical protein
MSFKGYRYPAVQDPWITFHDEAGRVSLDWANARVSLPRHRNAMHKRGAGSGDHLAAVAGDVTASDYAFHVFPLMSAIG